MYSRPLPLDVATVRTSDCSLYYTTGGADTLTTDETAVVFVSEAGLGGWSWGWQHAALAAQWTSVTWDLRGTGRSDCPPGPYSRETLVADFEAVCRDCGVSRAHVVGLGLGGVVALEAARTTSRVKTLTLCGTGIDETAFDLGPLFAPPTDRTGLERSLEKALSVAFRRDQPAVVDGIVDWRMDGDASLEGWQAQLAALEGFDAREWLLEVTQPTRVFHGTADALVEPTAGRELARGLPRGSFVSLEDAGHLVTIERSRVVNDHVVGFLQEVGQ